MSSDGPTPEPLTWSPRPTPSPTSARRLPRARRRGRSSRAGSRAGAAAGAGARDGAPRPRPERAGSTRLRAFYGDAEQVKGIDLDFHANEVTAIIGPSGCGKSTMVRCINRMHEEIPGAHAEGSVLLDDARTCTTPAVDVVAVRRAIGMVFQKPNPFPTMSIFDNVAAGLRLTARADAATCAPRSRRRCAAPGCGRRSRTASPSPGAGLSGGQQQRLCIARSLAVDPEVILMDEPCSALDPIATLKIEELIEELKAARDDRDRHAQHAAGRARRRPHGVHARRRARRGRPDAGDLHEPERPADRGICHRQVRLTPAARTVGAARRTRRRTTGRRRRSPGAPTSRSSSQAARDRTRSAAST